MTRKEAEFFINEMKNVRVQSQESSEDCVSRKELLKIYEDRFTELQKLKHLKDNKGAEDRQMGVNYCINILKELPSVTPVACIATVKLNKDDLQELVDEKVEELRMQMGEKDE